MTDTVYKVYVYGEHCGGKAGLRAWPEDESDDYTLYEGTSDELRELANALESQPHTSSYHRRVIELLRAEIN